MAEAIQTYTERRKKSTESKVEALLRHPDLTEEQKETLVDYHTFCAGGGNGRMKSLQSVYCNLKLVAKFGLFIKKPFNMVVRKDLEQFSEQMAGSGLSESYRNLTLIQVKAFYRWLYKTEDYPAVVKWLKPKLVAKDIKAEDLLTDDEVKKMLFTCNGEDLLSIRNRTILMVLYDSGGRISEILGTTFNNVIEDDYGIKLSITGKTGRNIRLIKSVKYVRDWLDVHPHKDNAEMPLFVALRGNFGQAVIYSTVLDMLNKMRKKAGIRKRVNPHSFRHMACTRMSRQGFTPTEMSIVFGWKKGSFMYSRYDHNTFKEVEEKMLKKAGIYKPIEEEVDKLKTVTCHVCGVENRAEKDNCEKCRAVINQRIISEKDRQDENIRQVKDVLNFGINNPETKDKLAELLAEIVEKMKED